MLFNVRIAEGPELSPEMLEKRHNEAKKDYQREMRKRLAASISVHCDYCGLVCEGVRVYEGDLNGSYFFCGDCVEFGRQER